MADMENGIDTSNTVLTYAEAFPPLSSQSPTNLEVNEVNGTPPKTSWGSSSTHAIPTSTVTQIFHVPIEERRYKSKVSPFGTEHNQLTVVRDIMAKSGCTIETNESKDHSLAIVVTGKPSAVKEAHRQIKSLLKTKVVYEIKIPKEHHGYVLGKQGAKLKHIEQSTNTKISIPKADDKSDVIKITGNREDSNLAREEIEAISNDLYKNSREEIDIPSEYQPFVYGPNGVTAAGIMERTGVKINMPPFSSKKTGITIVGDKEGIAKAKDEIMKLSNNAKTKFTAVCVEIHKSQHKYIVQKKIGTNEILSKTGVYVDVPPVASDTKTVTLRGPQEKMGEALTLVYGKANSMVSEEVIAPSWLHRFIIGRKGENIKNITRDLPHVTVTFPKDGDVITIEGPPDEVKHVKQSFENFTEGLMATMVYAEVSVPQKFHPHVIGKKGANINRIKEETCTSISIPSDKEKSDVIRIEGDPQGVAAAKMIITDMMAKLKNELSDEVSIEQKWHKLIIGANGDNMKEIHDRYPGVHVAFPEQGRRSNTVTLRGPSEEVKQCSSYLEKYASDIVDSNYRTEVRISKKYYGTIIGKGGGTLRKIKEETGTRIDLPREDSESDTIIIIGRKENVEKAKKKLHEIEKQVASVVDVVVRIPHKQHNAIIGPKGRLIRSIMDDCGGVRIHFPSGDTESDEVRIHGPKEEVSKARTMLMDVVNKHALENYTVEIKCKPEYHRFLIGKGGAKIRKVRDELGARVIFPQKDSDDESDLILIIGQKENVEATKTHIYKLIKELENIVQEEIIVDHKHHRHFIQRRGQLIQEISEDNGGVIISFPKAGTNSDKVLLKGAKKCVEGAKAAIEETIEDLVAQVVIKCVIPHKNHRDVMGPKGTNVQGITQDHNVTIKFPDRDRDRDSSAANKKKQNGVGSGNSGSPVPPMANGHDSKEEKEEEEKEEEIIVIEDPRDVIIIMGRKENCELAKKALQELVPVRISVDVPFEFHRFIIGARGQDVRSMADKFGVSIEVPSHEAQENNISVFGPAQNCESAKLALEVRVQELEAEREERELRSYREVLPIEPKYHPNIIGKRGATINKIREECDVRIQLPDKDQSDNKDIVVIGYEHQVQAAKEAILKIIRELENQITDDIEIDHRVHSRLIGAKGKAIAKVMEKFKVVVRFPKDKSGNTVSVTGLEENLEDAKEHLMMLAEDYMQDVIEKQEEEYLRNQYTRNTSRDERKDYSAGSRGFMVEGAPWSGEGKEEFPAINSTSTSTGSATTFKTPLWGPSTSGPKLPKDY